MRFSEPVMVVPEPSKVVYNCSNNSIILSGVPVYPPICLFYSQISHSASSPQPSILFARAKPLFNPLVPLVVAVSSCFYLDPSTYPLSLHFPHSERCCAMATSRWSVIIPSIPSRSLRPHIIRSCEGIAARNRNRPTAPQEIVTKSYN